MRRPLRTTLGRDAPPLVPGRPRRRSRVPRARMRSTGRTPARSDAIDPALDPDRSRERDSAFDPGPTGRRRLVARLPPPHRPPHPPRPDVPAARRSPRRARAGPERDLSGVGDRRRPRPCGLPPRDDGEAVGPRVLHRRDVFAPDRTGDVRRRGVPSAGGKGKRGDELPTGLLQRKGDRRGERDGHLSVVPPHRQKHREVEPEAQGELGPNATPSERMRHKLRTPTGRALYRMRKAIVEPVFGQIKSVRGLDRFVPRGLDNVRPEFLFIAMTHNVTQALSLRRALRARSGLNAARSAPRPHETAGSEPRRPSTTGRRAGSFEGERPRSPRTRPVTMEAPGGLCPTYS